MRSILALDVSGKCTGWAFGLPGDRPISGIVQWRREGDTEDEVFRAGGVWLTKQMAALQPEIVAIEAPIKRSGGGYTSPASQTMLLGLQGVLRFVVKAKLPGVAHLVASSTARKTFLGKGGNFDGDVKYLVQQECLRRGFIAPEDLQGDRCDALALWTHMAAQQMRELAFTPPPKPKARREPAQETF